MINVKDLVQELHLLELVPSSKTEWDIRSADLNRPGMQFCGYYEYFAFERPQLIGKVEMTYLESLPSEARHEMLSRYFSYNIPCVIICRGMKAPPELLSEAAAHDIPVYQTQQVTTRFTISIQNYLSRCLAPRVTRHGVLVNVNGVGVLLTGESGVGKSEAALELIKRGHQLVADDVVDIVRVNDSLLIGECPEMVRHLMEIRGIGIIDIRAMYGVGAVMQSKAIDMEIHLEHWKEDKEYDRLGLTEDSVNILGIKLPYQILPVKPGRNVAVIIEVAACNHSLKNMGYSAARELDRRLNEAVARMGGETPPMRP